jgi:SAM-dependent methyltransferase
MTGDTVRRQEGTDELNASFWDELCGSALARSIGVEDASEESLRRYDAAYMAQYPYLDRYVPDRLDGAEVLEIGLGYGTVSSLLMDRGARYHGVDIARGPVDMVRHRARLAGQPLPEQAIVQASALELPHPDSAFDYVVTIGCLHHTGDIQRAVHELHRVLRAGGSAVVMLYNRHSFRQLVKVRPRALLGRAHSDDEVAAFYDANAAGEAAPHVDYVSRADVRRIFSRFSSVRVESRNFDNTRFIPRRWLLGNVDRVLGLDLYITARK